VAKAATKTKRPSNKSLKKSARVAKQDVAANNAAGEADVTIDRRRSAERRDEEGDVAEAIETSSAPKLERRKKVNRRRQIDPTTCERDYTDQEVEFMNALDEYKRKSGRMFPTCSEVLEVIQSLGYVKLTAGQMMTPANGACAASAKPMPENLQLTASDEVFAVVGGLG
jgi:hypothetical protein